jgi:tetratricopeptide (TPR) repeat protein
MKNPEETSLYRERGKSRLDRGKYPGATADYEEVTRRCPKDLDAINQLGVSRFRNGDYKGALNAFKEAIKVNPASGIAYRNCGETRLKLGDYAGAITDFTRAIKLEPTSTISRNGRGLAYHYNGQFQAAIDEFDAALKYHPGGDPQHDPKAAPLYSNRGEAKQCAADYAGSIKDLKAALALRPEDEGYRVSLGHAYFLLGQEKNALSEWTKVIQSNSRNAYAFFRRGRLWIVLQDRARGLQDLDKALALDPKNEDMVLWATACGCDKARLKPIAKGTEWNAVVALFLLNEISRETLLNEAEAAKDEATRTERRAVSYRTLGLLADLAGNRAEARACYQRCVDALRASERANSWAWGRLKKLRE